MECTNCQGKRLTCINVCSTSDVLKNHKKEEKEEYSKEDSCQNCEKKMINFVCNFCGEKICRRVLKNSRKVCHLEYYEKDEEYYCEVCIRKI